MADSGRRPAAQAAAPVATQLAPSSPKRNGTDSPTASFTSFCTAGMRPPPPTSSTASSELVAAAAAKTSFSRVRTDAAAASKAARVKGTETSISGPSGPSGMNASSPISASGSMLSCFKAWMASLARRTPAFVPSLTLQLCFFSILEMASLRRADIKLCTPSASSLQRYKNSQEMPAARGDEASSGAPSFRAKRTTDTVPCEEPMSTNPTTRSSVPSGSREEPWL
mmetsp:Transcript_41806/g.97622  ORF Transcript_41806/g.97622 Transcript_41806/m.97622 type:complete len:225 (+) Transcript_41806:1062-1736(+)